MLATQGWQKSLDEEDRKSDNEDTEKVDPLEPMDKMLFESAGVDINKLRDEFYDMILYATQFISLATLGLSSGMVEIFPFSQLFKLVQCVSPQSIAILITCLQWET